MNIYDIGDWYATASPDERKKLLTQLRGYQVSPETWYIHPDDRLPQDNRSLKKFDLPEPGFINDWII